MIAVWRGLLLGLAAALAACSVDPLPSVGRPCGPANPCGPDAFCDLPRGLCVAVSLDRGPLVDVFGEQVPSEARARDALPADLFSPDRPGPGDGGCADSRTLCGPVCVDLATDASHCGACHKPCTTPTSDHCVDKLCVCGTLNKPCPAGSVCSSGICDANPCLGKGDGTVCDDKLYCTVSDACKGGACIGTARDCSGGQISPCAEATCDEAIDQCVTKNKVDGAPCGTGGQCYGGNCCTGCWNGTGCMTGSGSSSCGTDGDLCQDCTSLECRLLMGTCDSLFFDKCESLWAKPEGSSCNGGACRHGACCKGCWDGKGCKLGTAAAACGPPGGLCEDCTSECRTGSTCSGGTCADPQKPDGTACAGGQCLSGICCKGCIANGTCHAGTAPASCGVGASTCKTCPAATLECQTATCTNGSCGIGPATGTSCPNGKCLSGVCCKGCISGSSCYPGTAASHCGKNGVSCVSCPSATPTCNTAGSCV